jgi:glycosyltransferase involved in cell wall biosynthesis
MTTLFHDKLHRRRGIGYALQDTPPESWLRRFAIAVVIPAFNVEDQIEGVLKSMPPYVRHIIVVNDASQDRTKEVAARVASGRPEIILLDHGVNQGVGGAMVTGFREALRLGAQVIVKIDGDGQMCPDDMPSLLLPLIWGEADYAKGNRFRDFQTLRQMPPLRRAGNMALSFLAKSATGYWSCFDPTNGFVAIRADVLRQIPLNRVHRSYFFEISMLSQLYLLNAAVQDVPLPARYGSETSNLSIKGVLREFPRRLTVCLLRRMLLKNFIYDFTLESVFLLSGIPMLLLGSIYGGYNWIRSAINGVTTPAGTVVISAMLIILGFQLLLAALGADLQAVPSEPTCNGPLQERPEPIQERTYDRRADHLVHPR